MVTFSSRCCSSIPLLRLPRLNRTKLTKPFIIVISNNYEAAFIQVSARKEKNRQSPSSIDWSVCRSSVPATRPLTLVELSFSAVFLHFDIRAHVNDTALPATRASAFCRLPMDQEVCSITFCVLTFFQFATDLWNFYQGSSEAGSG